MVVAGDGKDEGRQGGGKYRRSTRAPLTARFLAGMRLAFFLHETRMTSIEEG
jgi:hypothetical protein